MAVKNAKVGGADWTNGSILDAGDVNDTLDEFSGVHRRRFSTAAFSDSTNTWVVAGSTLFGTSGGLITGIHEKIDLQANSAATTLFRLRISGANLGQYYANAGSGFVLTDQNWSPFLDTTAYSNGALRVSNNVRYIQTFTIAAGLPIEDDNTVCYTEIKTGGGSLFSAVTDLIWAKGFIDD